VVARATFGSTSSADATAIAMPYLARASDEKRERRRHPDGRVVCDI
jgi:hypothetical protein